MFDFAVNTCHYSLEDTVRVFLDSGIAQEFGEGNPKFIAGRTGCELFWDCLWELNIEEPPCPPAMYEDKTPEYWFGWAVAYYQWLRRIPFETIFAKISPRDIRNLYWPLHEADDRKFVEVLDEYCRKPQPSRIEREDQNSRTR